MSFSFPKSLYHRIFAGEAVIHTPEDPYEILATNGLCSCIAFAGWEPHKKIGFMVHFGGAAQVADFYSRGIELLSSKCGREDLSTFQCAIRGGAEKIRCSPEILQALKKELHTHESIRFEIVQEDPLSDLSKLTVFQNPKSLSLDCGSGIFSDYNIDEDPEPRVKTPEEEAKDIKFSIFENLVYREAE